MIVNTLLSVVIPLAMVVIVVRLLRDLAHSALQVARARELTDPLTDLLNRRGVERYGARKWRELADRGDPAAVIAVDIDHFKQVNDTFGHAAGDDLIRKVAVLLNSQIRDSDITARLGGEEF